MPSIEETINIIETLYWVTEGKEFRSEDTTLIDRAVLNAPDHINLLTVVRINGIIGTVDENTARWEFKNEKFYILISYYGRTSVVLSVFIDKTLVIACWCSVKDGFLRIKQISVGPGIKVPKINVPIYTIDDLPLSIMNIIQGHIQNVRA